MAVEVGSKQRQGGRKARRAARSGPEDQGYEVVTPGMSGGRFAPLSPTEISRVYNGALTILETVGLTEAVPSCISLVTANGGRLDDEGRLLFPRGLVDDVIATAAQHVTLPGFTSEFDLEIGGDRVHLGVGGAAVSILDGTTQSFRDSQLEDLYRLCRIVEASEHIHYVLRPVVARDMPTTRELDLNTAYACMVATRKPIGMSCAAPQHVAEAVSLFDMALGGEGRFQRRPFCFGSVCHVVPPLKFAPDACLTLEAMVEAGMPLQICSAGQAGATSPAALAGALVQGLAECLAGLVYVNLLRPGYPCILAFMPMVSDLRTGAMSGGGGEGAVASAAAAQILNWLDLPSTVCAGMTDAKLPDNQAGFEKAYTVVLAAQAGANMVNLSCGMLASIMAASPEAMVIDNEMHGAILRTVRGIEVNDDMLSIEVIAKAAKGEGHYLGQPQTMALMQEDFLYPTLVDRLSIADWTEAGAETLWARARRRVEAILATPPPGHVAPEIDDAIRARFPIHLPRGTAR